MSKNIYELNSNNEEKNVIRSLGHNALIELLNNNNNEIENEKDSENETNYNESTVNEINLFEINNFYENESIEKEGKERKCLSTKLLSKSSHNMLNENKTDVLNYDNNLNAVKTDYLSHNYFNTLDKNTILLPNKSPQIFINSHIKKKLKKNLANINNVDRNIINDADLYNMLEKKRKIKIEMLENDVTHKDNTIYTEKKKKDAIYFNSENKKNIYSENSEKISEKKKDNITDNNVKNSDKKYTPKNIKNNAIVHYRKKSNLKMNDLSSIQEENDPIKNEEKVSERKNKKDRKNSIGMNLYYNLCNNIDDTCNSKINTNSSKKREKSYSMNSNIINEDKDKDINSDQYYIKKKEENLNSNDDNMQKNENNLKLNEEKINTVKNFIKIEESDFITDNTYLTKSTNLLKNSNIDENMLKDNHIKKAINSENFIFLDFNPTEQEYLKIKETLDFHKKNKTVCIKGENIDHYSNSKNNIEEVFIKKGKVDNPNLDHTNNSDPLYIKKKYNQLKETLSKKKINIIKYDFETNLCYMMVKKSSTL